MRTLFLIIAALLTLGILTGYSQTDSLTTEPMVGEETMNDDQPHIDNDAQQMISHKDLPRPIRQTLERGDQYEGWENGMWYRDNTSGVYILDFGAEGPKRIYHFDENGNPLNGQVPVEQKKRQDE